MSERNMLRYALTLFILWAGIVLSQDATDLFAAAERGKVAELETLLTSQDIDTTNILGETPLMLAIEECQTEAARVLLKHGAKYDYYTKLGYSPLLKAAALGCTDIVRLLLSKKIDIDQQDPQKKFNPLFKAVERNHDDVVELLLSKGANVNYQNIYNVTPLIVAAQKGNMKIVKRLVEEGADVNAKSLINETPLLCALDYGHANVAAYLIDHGANVKVIDTYKRSTLMLAASLGDSSLVSMLVEKGVDLDLKTDKDETAAVIAQKKKFDNIVDFLLKSGADSTGLVFPDTTSKKLAQSDLYDTPPEPIGGIAAVQKRLRYPRNAKNAGLEGTIKVLVTIDRRNRVSKTEILESFGDKSCEQAAIRAIRNCRWKAAKKGKKSVEASIEIPVEFKLK